MRDGDSAVAQFSWSRGQNIWAVPSIYPVDSEGKLADGCRAIETLRTLYDLDMMFDNLRGARERGRKGVLVSEELKRRPENAPPQQKTSSRLEVHVYRNPVWLAERRYVEQHRTLGLMEKLFDELFPSGG